MNKSKNLKLILYILICILIILIGIIGIYTKSSNMYKDILPTYILGSDISGSTVIEFEVDNSKDTIYYDKEGNEVDSSEVTEENKKDYTSEEIPVNSEESLNSENYKKVIKIMEKRLEFLDVNQYKLDLDEETGKILLTVEDDYIEDIESILPMEGKLQLIDSNTEDIIITNSDFISAEATYASLTSEVITYINLNLNDSGIEKISNIDKYKVVEDEESEESKLILMFDNDSIAEISYDDILLSRKTLRITTATGLTSDSEINSELNINTVVSKLATIGKAPVIYNLTSEEFVKEDNKQIVNYMILGLIAICTIVSIALIITYRLNGLLGVIGFITNISIFLIIIRLTKIQISLNGFAGFVGLILSNIILINNILKAVKENEKEFLVNIKKAYLKSIDAIIVVLIIFIIFAFSDMTLINSMGLLLFWGWLITLLGYLIFTVPMLAVTDKK